MTTDSPDVDGPASNEPNSATFITENRIELHHPDEAVQVDVTSGVGRTNARLDAAVKIDGKSVSEHRWRRAQ